MTQFPWRKYSLLDNFQNPLAIESSFPKLLKVLSEAENLSYSLPGGRSSGSSLVPHVQPLADKKQGALWPSPRSEKEAEVPGVRSCWQEVKESDQQHHHHGHPFLKTTEAEKISFHFWRVLSLVVQEWKMTFLLPTKFEIKHCQRHFGPIRRWLLKANQRFEKSRKPHVFVGLVLVRK